jgi:hypothetical protein
MRTNLLNFSIYGGLLSVAYGCYSHYAPLGWIVGGGLVTALGVFVAWFKDDKPKGGIL